MNINVIEQWLQGISSKLNYISFAVWFHAGLYLNVNWDVISNNWGWPFSG